MVSSNYDLIYLREALDSLEAYLLSPELFWNFPVKPPIGEPNFPALTLGGILLAEQRLQGRKLTQANYAEFIKLSQQLEVTRSRWRTAWEKKAASGFHARLNQWRNFLEDYRRDQAEHANRYPYEVRIRVMLALLGRDNPFIPDEQRDLLASLDVVLDGWFRTADFIWDETYQSSFPRDQYRYLYGLLPESISD